jgi:hypothetical protein
MIPRLLDCKGCSHTWRAAEVQKCPECDSADVRSRCGAKTPKGPCQRLSAYGGPRCKRHNGRNAAKSEAKLGRFSSWSNRTYAGAILKAASIPELRDLTNDHAMVMRKLDEAAERAEAGEGGRAAWRTLVRLHGAMKSALDEDPDRLEALIEKLGELVAQEKDRSSALVDMREWAELRASMLDTESKIQHRAKAAIPIADVQIMVMVAVQLVREFIAPEAYPAFARRIRQTFPHTNTEGGEA